MSTVVNNYYYGGTRPVIPLGAEKPIAQKEDQGQPRPTEALKMKNPKPSMHKQIFLL